MSRESASQAQAKATYGRQLIEPAIPKELDEIHEILADESRRSAFFIGYSFALASKGKSRRHRSISNLFFRPREKSSLWSFLPAEEIIIDEPLNKTIYRGIRAIHQNDFLIHRNDLDTLLGWTVWTVGPLNDVLAVELGGGRVEFGGRIIEAIVISAPSYSLRTINEQDSSSVRHEIALESDFVDNSKTTISDNIQKSIEASPYRWRTVEGISKAVGMPEPAVERILQNDSRFIRADIKSRNGHTLYSTKATYRKRTGRLRRIGDFLTGVVTV